MRILLSLTFAGVIFLVSSIVADRTLGLLGFPSDIEEQYAHPPRYRQVIKNIEFEYTFETNSQGLRYKEIPLQKPQGTSRILVLGDSFVEGHGVTREETFSAVLENTFNAEGYPINFLNAGLSGTGPLQQGKLLVHVGQKYQPDGLLVCIFPNDIADTPETASPAEFESKPQVQRHGIRALVYTLWPRAYILAAKSYSWRHYLNRTKPADIVTEVSHRAAEVGLPQERIDGWKARLPQDLVAAANKGTFGGPILSYGLLYPEFWTDGIDINTERAEVKWKSMVALLTEIVHRGRQQGMEVGVVFIPFGGMYDPAQFDENVRNPGRQAGVHIRREWLTEQSEIQKRLENWAHGEGISFLDLTPTFRQAITQKQPLNYVLDGHWNADGHRIAAQAIAQWLKTRNVFSFLHPSKEVVASQLGQ